MGGACRRAGGLAAVAGLLLLATCTGGRTGGAGPPAAACRQPPCPSGHLTGSTRCLTRCRPGHRALIRALPIAGPSVLPDSRAWAILYHSRDFDGRDVAVSGVVVAPPVAAPPGGRAMVVWGHGSSGLADRCAPSRAGVVGAFGRWLGGLLLQGEVAAATDYQGLGMPGPARSAIGLSAGHAVLWAAELARSYAPELQVLGVAASALGAELATGLKAAAPGRPPSPRGRCCSWWPGATPTGCRWTC